MSIKKATGTKQLVERYLDAASNLYGIAPLSIILSIYNSQNDPLTEESFLSIVDEVTKKHKFFSIVGEDEFYDDVEETKPIDREVVAEYLLSIDDDDYYEANRWKIIRTRERITKELREIGFEVLDSSANFLFAKPNFIMAEELYKALKEKGILVRFFNKPLICDYLRITVGTDEEMDALMATIKEVKA